MQPTPDLRTRLVLRGEYLRALSIGLRAFLRHWDAVFTDPRAPADRRPEVPRAVFEDELATAVDAGGRVSDKAKGAVLMYRQLVSRLRASRTW